MAKREIIEVVDDIDGKVLEEYETVQYAIDGRNYEFDTSSKHADEFRSTLQKYLDVSRPVRPQRRDTASTQRRSRDQLQAIRNWANANGYEVSDRGRIPAGILEAFDAVH